MIVLSNQIPVDLSLPYQKTGVEWLISKRLALLGDEMGLGKTYQVIKALERLNNPPVLVICPAIARLTWEKEFRKWSSKNLNIQVITNGKQTPNAGADVVICSFDYATTDQPKKTKEKIPAYNPLLVFMLALQKNTHLVVDESHFLKSVEARRTQAVIGAGALIHHVKRAWFLTGTPMPNAPHELWPMLKIFGATHLNYEAFVKKFCETYPFNGQQVVTGAKRMALPELRSILSPHMLRRLKKNVLKDLPKVMRSEVIIEPDLKKLPLIRDEDKELLRILQLTEPNEQIKALELNASSIATLRRYCGLQKVFPLCELIESELQNNAYDKIVIFCIHKEIASQITHSLSRFGAVLVNGTVSASNRQKAIDDFQSAKNTRVFVGNIQAAGTNITLTAAHQMVFIEEDYVPGNNDQAVARCNRIGQTMPVNVRFARMSNSIDQKINEILLRKSSDSRILLGA